MPMTARVTPSPHRRDSAGPLFALIAIAGAALLIVGWSVSTYNRLVRADQEVRARWAQLQDVYQRRADLVPDLVESVRGAGAPDTRTFTDVAQARARVGQLPEEALQHALEDPEAFARFQAAQQTLSVSLHRLLALSETNPELRATANLRDLQAQLEGTETRVSLERQRFNEAVREYNKLRNDFPSMLVAHGFGDRFEARPYLETAPETQKAPAVRF